MGSSANLFHYVREVAHGPVKVVVDDHMGRELKSLRLLQPAESNAAFYVLLRISPGPEPLLLHRG